MFSRLFTLLRKRPQQSEQPKDDAMPFRLLDLPKELRLMIYEEMAVSWNRHEVPLDDSGTFVGTLVNPSLLGVRLLATCHFINDEAGKVIKPRLKRVLQTPPTLHVDLDQLQGLAPLRNSFRCHSNLVERIMSGISYPLKMYAIHRYRTGHRTIGSLRGILGLNEHFSDDDIKATTSFILRATAYKNSEKSSSNLYPPLAIVVSVPASFSSCTITFTTSRSVRFWYYLLLHRHRQPVQTIQATTSFLVFIFAYYVSRICGVWRVMSVSAMLRLPDEAHLYSNQSGMEVDFETSLGVGANMSRDASMVKYGGLYTEAEEEE
jgi:hypothetical protein